MAPAPLSDVILISGKELYASPCSVTTTSTSFPFEITGWTSANFPEFIVREYLLNEKLTYDETWLDNCLNLRYDKEFYIIDEKTN